MMITLSRRCMGSRFGMMAAGWGTVGLFYCAGRLTPRTARILRENEIDRLIAFDSSAIWLYLSFFFLVPAAYFLAEPERLKPLTQSMQMSAIIAGVAFLVWPTALIYPVIPPDSLAGMALTALASLDSAQNCFPSLHGALTLQCVVAIWQRERRWRSAFFLIWGIAVMFSVVQTRRHLSVDLGAGVLLGAICIWFAGYLASSAKAGTKVASL